MYKLITIITVLVITISLSQYTPYAALKDFKDNVEKDEKSSSGKSSSYKSSKSNNTSDTEVSECVGNFYALWFFANLNVRYLDYPYMKNDYDNNFVIFSPEFLDDDYVKADRRDTKGQLKPEFSDIAKKQEFYDSGSFFYLKPEAGALYAFSNGYGYYASLTGKFYKIIGPELEMRRLDDGSDHLNYYAAGINISLLQYGGFLLDMHFQAAYMRGILDRNGSAAGVVMTLYPVKPITLTVKAGTQAFGKVNFFDGEVKIGVMLQRVELSTGCRYIASKSSSITSIMFGVTMHL